MINYLKFVKNKKIQCTLILSILFTIYIFFCAYTYATHVSSNLSNTVLRLHVIANSNSENDQNLKYIVRDNLISYMNTLSINCSSKEEVIQIANENLNEFKRIAQNTIYDNGYNYDVSVELGTFEFPSKTYGDISFPAGIYDALRIKIGNASGNNWWCVMFPPLCFVDITTGIVPNNSKKHLENSLPKEEYSIISNQNNSSYKIKFKLIEFFEKKGLITAQNN